MNSLVEAEPEDLARHVCTLISDNREDTCITGSEEGEMRMIHIESKLAGIPFYFTFRMEMMNRDEFCKQLTTPLMLLVVQQQTRLAQLQAMLIAKDSEIEQYKLEGAILKKRKMETQPFLLSELAQNESEKFNSIDPPNSIDLFKKITVDLIQSEPEEKCETRHFIASTEVTSAKEEKSSTEAQNVSVTQVGKSKKIKLRI
ncbi:Non-homologous end-joining factor 1 [Gryllus bimaculatus]|nr:Non-homologous end-joining factor 1 [Gryllus bimaculatus]